MTTRAKSVGRIGWLPWLGILWAACGPARVGPESAVPGPDAAPEQTGEVVPADPGEPSGVPEAGTAAGPVAGEPRDYPGTRRLCAESVLAAPGSEIREIHWTLDASEDAYETVATFYRAQAGEVEETEGPGLRLDRGEGRIVSVYPVSRRDAYPHCDERPRGGERTLILTSVAIRVP